MWISHDKIHLYTLRLNSKHFIFQITKYQTLSILNFQSSKLAIKYTVHTNSCLKNVWIFVKIVFFSSKKSGGKSEKVSKWNTSWKRTFGKKTYTSQRRLRFEKMGKNKSLKLIEWNFHLNLIYFVNTKERWLRKK